MNWIDPTVSRFDPEGDACDDTARDLNTDDPRLMDSRELRQWAARQRKQREDEAAYRARPFCALEGCVHRQTATGPRCIKHLIETFEFGGGKL